MENELDALFLILLASKMSVGKNFPTTPPATPSPNRINQLSSSSTTPGKRSFSASHGSPEEAEASTSGSKKSNKGRKGASSAT